MSWPMCKADFNKHHAEDQTVFFSQTEKGPCFLCGEPGLFREAVAGSWPAREKKTAG